MPGFHGGLCRVLTSITSALAHLSLFLLGFDSLVCARKAQDEALTLLAFLALLVGLGGIALSISGLYRRSRNVLQRLNDEEQFWETTTQVIAEGIFYLTIAGADLYLGSKMRARRHFEVYLFATIACILTMVALVALTISVYASWQRLQRRMQIRPDEMPLDPGVLPLLRRPTNRRGWTAA